MHVQLHMTWQAISYGCQEYMNIPGLKVGRMIRTIWVTWVTFLLGQMDLIHKLNYLDVTQIFNRSHVL